MVRPVSISIKISLPSLSAPRQITCPEAMSSMGKLKIFKLGS